MIAFLILLLASAPGIASASTPHEPEDSVQAAVSAIEGFYNESAAITKDFEERELAPLRKDSLEQKGKALSELKNLRLTVEPGEMRFKNVYEISDSYMKDEMGRLKGVLPGLSKKDRSRMEEALEKLAASREKKLRGIEEAYQREKVPKEKPRPMPVDRPPTEAPPEDRGLWYR